MEKNIVIYKDGSYKFVDVSWEYENDPDWLTTIILPVPTIEINANHILDSIKTVYTNVTLGRQDNHGILSAVIADFEELIRELTNPAPPSSPTATAEEDFFKSIKWRIGKVITSKFLESNEGKFHTALEFNPAIHAAAEFCEHEKQEARRQAIDEIQTMIMHGNRAMTVVDFYDELEKLKK